MTSRRPDFNPYTIPVIYKWFATVTVIFLVAAGIKQTPYLLIIALAIYNGIFGFLILKRSLNQEHKLLLLGIDFAICVSLLIFSGGWASPYFQYGLSFLILSALLFGFTGAGLSITLYGIFYFIGLRLNSFGIDKIIAEGYLESFIIDYAIFIAVGLSSAFISKVINSLGLQVNASEDK
ncbi:MAG: hypothetical protein IBX64_03360 [Actinobacteria bacterium]|nr:hypothetical protein [Actinomycetota bacterium]